MASRNEGRCCDAVLRILEESHGSTRERVNVDTTTTPGLEVVCKIGDQWYAVEHTLIEPFPQTKVDDIAFSRFIDGLEDELKASVPADSLVYLWVDVYAFRGMKELRLREVRQQISDWAKRTVPQLPQPEDTLLTSLTAWPPDVPVRVTLQRTIARARGGTLLAGRFAPGELKQLREERILTAFEKKGPKLQAAKNAGQRSVLVLESDDIALTSSSIVGEVIETLAPRIVHMPDEVYFVDTSTKDDFYVFLLRRDGEMFPMASGPVRHWRFAAGDLEDL